MKNNVILIGMMGSGKTTVGKELEKILKGFSCVDIDDEIEKSTQKKISEIFLRHGEKFFRILENEKIKHFSLLKNQIISCGGGAFENSENRKILKENGFVIYLKASPKAIYDRILNEKTDIGKKRPLLKQNFSIEKITDIIKKRSKNYEKADFVIDTTEKNPSEIAKEVFDAFREY